MVYFKENNKFPRGGPTIFRGGSNFFEGRREGDLNAYSL